MHPSKPDGEMRDKTRCRRTYPIHKKVLERGENLPVAIAIGLDTSTCNRNVYPGRPSYLSQASALGDELYAIVARASMIKHKPKLSLPDEHRILMVQALKVVDHVVLGSETGIFEPFYEIVPDIIALGFDQRFDAGDLECGLAERGFDTEVVRVKGSNSDRLCSTRRIVDRILEMNKI